MTICELTIMHLKLLKKNYPGHLKLQKKKERKKQTYNQSTVHHENCLKSLGKKKKKK